MTFATPRRSALPALLRPSLTPLGFSIFTAFASNAPGSTNAFPPFAATRFRNEKGFATPPKEEEEEEEEEEEVVVVKVEDDWVDEVPPKSPFSKPFRVDEPSGKVRHCRTAARKIRGERSKRRKRADVYSSLES